MTFLIGVAGAIMTLLFGFLSYKLGRTEEMIALRQWILDRHSSGMLSDSTRKDMLCYFNERKSDQSS